MKNSPPEPICRNVNIHGSRLSPMTRARLQTSSNAQVRTEASKTGTADFCMTINPK